MSAPFDQLTTLAGANQTLALKLFEALRAAGQRQASIASHAFSAATQQKDGFGPGIGFPDFSDVLKEIEQSRQAAVADTKQAIEEWRTATGGAFSIEEGQQQVTNALQGWSRLFLVPWSNAAPASDTPVEPPKAAETKGSAGA